MTYASSDYTVSASSQFNTTIWNPYSVFNSNTAYGWISKTVLTIKNSGKYIGTIATTLVSGLSISGEWIQIRCRITASPRRTWWSPFQHKQFKLFGVLSGLYKRIGLVFTGYANPNNALRRLYRQYIGNTEVYRYYRVIVTTGDPSMLINASGINGLFISGYYADRIQTGVFSSTTYPEITSYSVSDIYDTTFVLSWGIGVEHRR
jgi:hypothetical protein